MRNLLFSILLFSTSVLGDQQISNPKMRKLDVKNNFSGGAVIVDNVQVDIPLDASYTAFYAVTLEPVNINLSGVNGQIAPDNSIKIWNYWNYNGVQYSCGINTSVTVNDHMDDAEAVYLTKPFPPSSFAVANSSGYAQLSWEASAMAYQYLVERNVNSAGWIQIGTSNTTSYTDYGFTVIPGFPYSASYRVRAAPEVGYNSEYSSVQTVQGKTPGPVYKNGYATQATPTEFSIDQNYPNPFNPSTMINFALPQDASVSLKVYDLAGKEVATLVDSYQSAGSYSVPFDASKLSSGMYIYKIQAGTYSVVKKMQVLK